MLGTLILENFRCFAERIEVPIRPLTLLVGENSSGKTSFLAGLRAAYDLRVGAEPDFNEEPFHLGSYDQLANYRAGRAGRAKSFTIGQRFKHRYPRLRHRIAGKRPVRVSADTRELYVEAQLTSANAQPAISEFQISSETHELVNPGYRE